MIGDRMEPGSFRVSLTHQKLFGATKGEVDWMTAMPMGERRVLTS